MTSIYPLWRVVQMEKGAFNPFLFPLFSLAGP
jgi:hypothetical protein